MNPDSRLRGNEREYSTVPDSRCWVSFAAPMQDNSTLTPSSFYSHVAFAFRDGAGQQDRQVRKLLTISAQEIGARPLWLVEEFRWAAWGGEVFDDSVSALQGPGRNPERLAASRSSPFWPRRGRDHAAMLGGKSDPYNKLGAMSEPTPYHLLGKFIVLFQRIEVNVSEIIRLLIEASDEHLVEILMSELDNYKRLKTVDVLFSRFLDVRVGDFKEEKKDFHALVAELQRLGERRNEIVHSYYFDWRDTNGKDGLLRQQPKLRGKQGILENIEEGLLPEHFEEDLCKLTQSAEILEKFRLKIIGWRYPDE